jgi:(1->4)-alpha-D-glucan 1-alpha-D-glucosylmutase
LYEACAALQSALAQTLDTYNGTPGQPESFDRLHALLEAQSYRLSDWRVATDELNYRRFFDIVHLAGVRVEDAVVFEATHRFICQLLDEGKVTGLRIDHPDGLFDPAAYFRQLQQAYVLRHSRRLLAARAENPDTNGHLVKALADRFFVDYRHQPDTTRPLYLVVEKILETHEQLPEDWHVHGTTGYDFLNQLNGLFVECRHATAFATLYADFIGSRTTGAEILYTTKKLIIQTSLASELEALGVLLERLAAAERGWRDCTRRQLVAALSEVIACFPVYRTYICSETVTVRPTDRKMIDTAIAQARERQPGLPATVWVMLHDVLTLRYPAPCHGSTPQVQRLFVQKLQQMTGPAMAKGLEDTAFYRYTPLAALNEVGGDPDQFGISVSAFHQHNVTRQQHWPGTLLATSTHDTKRSEDVRARLNVLSEMPQQWHDCLWRWHHLNERHKMAIDGQLAPSRQDEYLLYQTLLGAWPLESLDAAGIAHFCERMQAYMRKAIREDKVHTSWVDPNNAYEDAVDRFVQALLDKTHSGPFLADFRALQQTVAHYGVWNSLAQTFLKLVSPGVPDCYQGCELWDFSLVDPDNRRPVDYVCRQHVLEEMQRQCQTQAQSELVRELLHTYHDGRIKLYVIWQTLTFRRAQAQLFLEGEYIPLQVIGSRQEHLCAFARRHGNAMAVAVAPRLFVGLLPEAQQAPLGQAIWGDTAVVLPDAFSGSALRQLFTGAMITVPHSEGRAALPLAVALAEFPVALLHASSPAG